MNTQRRVLGMKAMKKKSKNPARKKVQTKKKKAKKNVTCHDKPWLTHYDKGVPASIKYEEKLLIDYLESAAIDYPSRAAFIYQG
jgi:hypothetical protein